MHPTQDTSPDDLLDTFKGRGLGKIVFFTLAIHAVVLLGSSVPFLWEKIAGPDTSSLSEDERVKAAVKEASVSLRKIAEQHGIEPQDLSSSLAGGVPTASTAEPQPAPQPAPAATDEPPAEPKSAIEQELEKAEPGPEVPPVPEDDEVDLFR